MCLLDRVLQPLDADMGVDLRGREGFVAEELLHGLEVRAAIKQVRREGMSEGVGRGLGRQTRTHGPALDDVLHRARGEGFAPLVGEKSVVGARARGRFALGLEVLFDRPRAGAAKERDSLLTSLSFDLDEAIAEVEGVHLDAHDLRGAEAGGVHELEDRAIPERGLAGRVLIKEIFSLVLADDLGEFLAADGGFELLGRVVVKLSYTLQVARESAKRAELTRAGDGGASVLAEVLAEGGWG